MKITDGEPPKNQTPTDTNPAPEFGASRKRRILTVTVAYRSSEVILEHLKGLIDATDCLEARHVVIDNSTEERCREIVLDVQAQNPSRSIRYLALAGNPGYGAGVNLGITFRTAREYVFISNPDSVVSKASRLSDLVVVAEEHPSVAAVLPDVVHPHKGHPVIRPRLPTPATYSGWVLGTWLRALLPEGRPDVAPEGPQPVVAGDGSALLLTPRALKELRGFDARFFLFMEDTDLWKRIGDAGLQIAKVWNCTVLHHGGGSSSLFGKTKTEMAALAARGIYFEKFYGRRGLALFLAQMLPESVAIALVRSIRNRDFRYLLDIRKMASLAFIMWRKGPVIAQDLMVRPLFGSENAADEPGVGLSSRS